MSHVSYIYIWCRHILCVCHIYDEDRYYVYVCVCDDVMSLLSIYDVDTYYVYVCVCDKYMYIDMM